MTENFETTIRSVFAASDAGEIHFGQVVAALMAADIESYHVDYRDRRITCYRKDDAVMTLATDQPATKIADLFDADAVKAAIRGTQDGRIKFPEFKRLTQQAGCIGYTVWISGRHVTYFGRRGDMHIEHFPR